MENTIDITDVISCDSVNIFTNTGDTFKKECRGSGTEKWKRI